MRNLFIIISLISTNSVTSYDDREIPELHTEEVTSVSSIGLEEVSSESSVELAVELLKKLEGFRSRPYLCSAGKTTIGYGFSNLNKRYMSRSEANRILETKCTELDYRISKLIITEVTASQKAALISFTFNCGYYGFKNSTLLYKLNTGQINQVPSEFKRWVNVKVKNPNTLITGKFFNRGLYNRRCKEIKMWNRP